MALEGANESSTQVLPTCGKLSSKMNEKIRSTPQQSLVPPTFFAPPLYPLHSTGSPAHSPSPPSSPTFSPFSMRTRRTHLWEEIIFSSRPVRLQVLPRGTPTPKAKGASCTPQLRRRCTSLVIRFRHVNALTFTHTHICTHAPPFPLTELHSPLFFNQGTHPVPSPPSNIRENGFAMEDFAIANIWWETKSFWKFLFILFFFMLINTINLRF